MTVGSDLDEVKSEKAGPFYVRLQNLPFGACQKLVREFFRDLHIAAGGVAMHRNCAFVVFDVESDAQSAVAMDKGVLSGREVRVSNADRKDVRRTQLQDVRRKLLVSVPECWMMKCRKKRRIRPTSVVKDGSEGAASKKFCPEEIDFPGSVVESGLGNGFPGRMDEFVPENGKVPEEVDESGLWHGESGEKNGKLSGQESSMGNGKADLEMNKFGLENGKADGLENRKLKLTDDNIDGKIPGKLNESSFKNGRVSTKMSVSDMKNEKIPGKRNELSCQAETFRSKISEACFLHEKTKEPMRRMVKRKPTMKKTIKPTPVISLNQFKLVYEGTVF